jgi:DNA mismatch endonuclease (patch repair protein)
MAKVHGKDTAPELFVRRTAHSLGYRFRIHRADLPGCPDLVFPSRRKVIFVHGCFWHRHKGCKRASVPQARQKFWLEKFASNVARDKRNIAALIEAGWDVLVLWECRLRDKDSVVRELRTFLDTSERIQYLC